MNSLRISIIVSSISSIIILSHTPSAMATLRGSDNDGHFKPIVMRTGHTVGQEAERELQGRALRNTLRQAVLNEEFVDTYKRAFQYHFTHTVDPLTLSFLPEDIARVVPPALINKADILSKYDMENNTTMTTALMPSADEDQIDFRRMSLGFIRLGLTIKDAEEFSSPLLMPVKRHLMKLSYLKSAEIAESIVEHAANDEKTDAYTSIGQLYRWAAVQTTDQTECNLYQDQALAHFQNAHTFLSLMEADKDRIAYDKKIIDEQAKIMVDRLVKAFNTLKLDRDSALNKVTSIPCKNSTTSSASTPAA